MKKYVLLPLMLIFTNTAFGIDYTNNAMSNDLLKRPLSSVENFLDRVKTDPQTGAPLIARNGKWMTPDARLKQLARVTQQLFEATKTEGRLRDDASKLKMSSRVVEIIDKAGVPNKMFQSNGQLFTEGQEILKNSGRHGNKFFLWA